MVDHTDLTALRGNPSSVWRAGQERRLQMIARWTNLPNAHVLIAGIGVGMYAAKIREKYGDRIDGFDIEYDRVMDARHHAPDAVVAAAEYIPYQSNLFDVILSHEVLEHVQDDRMAVKEMVRVLKPGGRLIIFVPNRWYPFETHGHYWRGKYHFGNTPLINYLPNVLRNRLAPHVNVYTGRGLHHLFDGLPVTVITHHRIYGGYDNIIARLGNTGKLIRDTLYRFEGTPLDLLGLSHMLVIEKTK